MFNVNIEVDNSALATYVSERVNGLITGELNSYVDGVTRKVIREFLEAKVNEAISAQLTGLCERISIMEMEPQPVAEDDQELLDAVLRDGKTITEVALLRGVAMQTLRKRFFFAAKARNAHVYARASEMRPHGAQNAQLSDLIKFKSSFISDDNSADK